MGAFCYVFGREGIEGNGPHKRAKNHPVNGFLVPRAGGGTAPVTPDEPLHPHHNKEHPLRAVT